MAGRSSASATRSGRGLHTGAAAEVTLRAWDGPLSFGRDGEVVPLALLVFQKGERATTIARTDGTFRISTVEHLFAALAAHGIGTGCIIELTGPELPLLDGGALSWCEAIHEMALTFPQAATEPAFRITRDAEVRVGDSVYRFSPETSDAPCKLSVEFETSHPMLTPLAFWDGTLHDFARRIATARTFVSLRDLERFNPGELASYAPPESVVVLTDDGALFSGGDFCGDEPARHKLLDLVGDIFLALGGAPMPQGTIHAKRPGHSANHAAMARALHERILVRTP